MPAPTLNQQNRPPRANNQDLTDQLLKLARGGLTITTGVFFLALLYTAARYAISTSHTATSSNRHSSPTRDMKIAVEEWANIEAVTVKNLTGVPIEPFGVLPREFQNNIESIVEDTYPCAQLALTLDILEERLQNNPAHTLHKHLPEVAKILVEYISQNRTDPNKLNAANITINEISSKEYGVKVKKIAKNNFHCELEKLAKHNIFADINFSRDKNNKPTKIKTEFKFKNR